MKVALINIVHLYVLKHRCKKSCQFFNDSISHH